MNKQVKLAVAAAAVVIAMSPASYAQKADPSKGSGYVVGAEQNVVKNGFGQCWRTGYFTPAMAIAGCDDDLLPKPAPAPAPRVAP
ncbi:MAG: OmpA family protein, partial [Betaproteobacteria bacterium]